MVEPMSDERLDHLEAESKRRAFGLTERQTAEVFAELRRARAAGSSEDK
jgi:hypothetical protein